MSNSSWFRAAAIGVVVASATLSLSAPATAAGNPLPSVFVQLSSWGSAQGLDGSLADACNAGVHELVLTDVAAPTATGDPVLLEDRLERALTYFPGSTVPGCHFSRVFVGTIDLTSFAAGNPYSKAMLDSAWTASMRSRSEATARLFDRFARDRGYTEWDWYVSFEGMLNYLGTSPDGADTTALAAAFRDYLSGHLGDLDAIHRSRNFLWSPGMDSQVGPFIGATAEGLRLSAGLQSMTAGVRDALAQRGRDDPASGPLIIDLQDHVGSTDCSIGISPSTAASWLDVLRPSLVVAGLRMNVELFRHADVTTCAAGLAPGFRSAVDARVDYYRSRGIEIGAAFELRYWAPLYDPTWALAPAVLSGTGSRTIVDAGTQITLSGRLTDEGGAPLADRAVDILRCDFTWGSCVPIAGSAYTARTSGDGSASIVSPPLAADTHLRLAFAGDSSYRPEQGAPYSAYVPTGGSVALAWSDTTASSASVGDTSVIGGELRVAGVGWPMSGVDVVLVQCASATDCSHGIPVADGEVNVQARVEATTPALAAVPGYFQFRYSGTGTYATSASPIIVAGAADRTTPEWTDVRITPSTGGASIVSGTLESKAGASPADDSAVALERCSTPVDCQGAVEIASGTMAAGKVSIPTPDLQGERALFRLRFDGDGANVAGPSPVVAVGSTKGLGVAWSGLTAGRTGQVVHAGATLKVVDVGWTMDGANIILERCASATDCSGAIVIGAGTAGAGGVIVLEAPVATTGPAFVRLRFLGNGSYATGASPIMTALPG